MGDVYLSHGISHKGCLTSADADANLALLIAKGELTAASS
jgi:hypothetical protein